MRRTIVIGGGPAGLAAATYLARGGAEVTLLEAGKELGGRARTREEADALLNLGPHALYLGGEAREVLDELGVVAAGREPHASHALLEGRLHRFPTGPFSLLATGLLPLGAKFELGSLLGRLPRMDPSQASGSLREWCEASLQSPDARRFVEALGRLTTYAHAPDLLPASLALTQLQRSLQGVSYLHGGWARMVSELAEKAQSAGAKVLTSAAARRVEACEEGWRVETPRGAFAAETLVLALGPERVRALMESAAERLPEARPLHAACLDLVLEPAPGSRPSFVLGVDRPLYLSVHSDAAELGEGSVVHVARYLDPRESLEPQVLRSELETLCDQVLPGWRGRARAQVFAPRLLVSHDLPRDGLGARSGVEALAAPGVVLCGDWVGSEGWLLDASLASARRAAQALLQPARGSTKEAC